jgi:ActD protein
MFNSKKNIVSALTAIFATAGSAALAGTAFARRFRRRGTHTNEERSLGRFDNVSAFDCRLAARRTRYVIGSFADGERAREAAKSVRREWQRDFELYWPYMDEHLFEAIALPRSPTRFWILGGGIIGWLGGWATTIMLTIYWPHHVANMPLIAIPPFTIVSFELMVLFGVIAGFVGFVFHNRLPKLDPIPDFLTRFQRDRFGILLSCAIPEDVFRGEAMLEQLSADEIIRA